MSFYRRARGRLRRRHFDDLSYRVTEQVARAEAATMGEFAQLFAKHEGRTVNKWLHYLDVYDSELDSYRTGQDDHTPKDPVKLLEIGTQQGGSLQILQKYFGHDAELWAVDIDPRCARIDDPDLNIRIGSQADPEFLRSVVSEMGGVDIVIDDGSHIVEHQLASLRTLYPLLNDGGLYMIEDVHTSYWGDYGGGYGNRRGGIIENAKQIVDDIHSHYHSKGDKEGLAAATTIARVTFYDSIVAIKKQQQSRPRSVKLGKPTFDEAKP